MDFTGVVVWNVSHEVVEEFWSRKTIELEEGHHLNPYPHQCIVLKCLDCQSHSVLATMRPDCMSLRLVTQGLRVKGVSPRNKEQVFFMDRLMDDDVHLCIATGMAGTGKSFCASAVGLHKVVDGDRYETLILTKPMGTVGGRNIGAVPGELDEKFAPYLLSFLCGFEQLLGGRDGLTRLMEADVVRTIPVEVMRGASFPRSFIIADEVQSFTPHELKTLCTRVGEGSKLVLMGDPSQIDSRLDWKETGLCRLLGSEEIRRSPLVSQIELIKGVRSPLSELLAQVL